MKVAAQNRLKMSINVNTYYNQNDSIGLNNSAFSAFVDYDATSDFSSIEEELVENLNYQLPKMFSTKYLVRMVEYPLENIKQLIENLKKRLKKTLNFFSNSLEISIFRNLLFVFI